jgi:hypothetical protein
LNNGKLIPQHLERYQKIEIGVFMKFFGFLSAVLVSSSAFAATSIVLCDYQDKYRLQFQLEDKTGWVLEKRPNGNLGLSKSFGFEILKAGPSGGQAMGLKNNYVFKIPGALVTIDTATSVFAGSGMMTHQSGKKEPLYNCRD